MTGVLLAAALAVSLITPGAAAAPAPPLPGPDLSLVDGLDPAPSPLPGVTPAVACVEDLPGPPGVVGRPWVVDRLRLDEAWRSARGAGQTIAVIDTGVTPHPALAGRLLDGGDFVGPGDSATTDCDGHGTLVAGLAAAAEDPVTGFAGVAPEARVLAIRQSSATVSVPGRTSPGGGDVTTLARAILRAVELGATVVNISAAACLPASVAPEVLAPLRAAVRRAVDADVVVVAAAGNAGSGNCVQDDPAAGGDPQVVAPAAFADDVLAVGYVGRDGRPAARTVRGPWVGVAAPGVDVVSLSPTGPGLVDRIQPGGAPAETGGAAGTPVEGSSFAAPLVAGVAALVRERFPELTAREVVARIRATAVGTTPDGAPPDEAVGAGTVDAVAALTAPVTTGVVPGQDPDRGRESAAAAGRVDLTPVGDAHSVARSVALIGSGTAVLLGGAVLGTIALARRARRPR